MYFSKNVFMPSFSILWKGTFVETRALTRSEDVVRAGVHGGEGEELLSCLLSLNIEPHVVLVPKRLHMLLKDAFAVHFGTEGAELTNQLLGFRQRQLPYAGTHVNFFLMESF